MPIVHQWDAAGRAIRSNGLAEGHNESLSSVHPYFQLCRLGLSSKLPLRGENYVPRNSTRQTTGTADTMSG